MHIKYDFRIHVPPQSCLLTNLLDNTHPHTLLLNDALTLYICIYGITYHYIRIGFALTLLYNTLPHRLL